MLLMVLQGILGGKPSVMGGGDRRQLWFGKLPAYFVSVEEFAVGLFGDFCARFFDEVLPCVEGFEEDFCAEVGFEDCPVFGNVCVWVDHVKDEYFTGFEDAFDLFEDSAPIVEGIVTAKSGGDRHIEKIFVVFFEVVGGFVGNIFKEFGVELGGAGLDDFGGDGADVVAVKVGIPVAPRINQKADATADIEAALSFFRLSDVPKFGGDAVLEFARLPVEEDRQGLNFVGEVGLFVLEFLVESLGDRLCYFKPLQCGGVASRNGVGHGRHFHQGCIGILAKMRGFKVFIV